MNSGTQPQEEPSADSGAVGSPSGTATAYGREHCLTVVDGGCPLMFEPTADLATRSCA